MSLAADSGLTASPSPGSVRSLQALPEVSLSYAIS